MVIVMVVDSLHWNFINPKFFFELWVRKMTSSWFLYLQIVKTLKANKLVRFLKTEGEIMHFNRGRERESDYKNVSNKNYTFSLSLSQSLFFSFSVDLSHTHTNWLTSILLKRLGLYFSLPYEMICGVRQIDRRETYSAIK